MFTLLVYFLLLVLFKEAQWLFSDWCIFTFQKLSTSTANLEREDVALNLIFSTERNLSCIHLLVVMISVVSVQIFSFLCLQRQMWSQWRTLLSQWGTLRGNSVRLNGSETFWSGGNLSSDICK